MLTSSAKSPLSDIGNRHLIKCHNTNRKALQPKTQSNNCNTPNSTTTKTTKPKPTPTSVERTEISRLTDDSNKENVPPIDPFIKEEFSFQIESFDASLAEELSAIREKLERLRIDKEKTDKMLRERAQLMDLQLKEIVNRGEVQKDFEIEVDRLYRLKEIRLACHVRVSPLRTLRDKEQEKKTKQDQLKANSRVEERDDLHKEDEKSTSTSLNNSEKEVSPA